MLVYRYEHPIDGNGPYVHRHSKRNNPELEDLSDEIRETHNERSYTTHPGPWMDGLGCRVDWNSWVCGMNSPEKLRKWFWGFNGRLKKAGFVQKVYRVKDDCAHVSDRTGQVVFDRKYAEVLG